MQSSCGLILSLIITNTQAEHTLLFAMFSNAHENLHKYLTKTRKKGNLRHADGFMLLQVVLSVVKDGQTDE